MKDTNHYDNPPKTKKSFEARDEARQAARTSRRQNRGSGEIADWASADAALMLRVIAVLTKAGCAVQFSYTRDGGSYVIRIVGDGEPYNEYVRPSESLSEYLTGLALDFG